MQKIMFNDRFGLTEAVLKGTKTMTRRVIADKDEIDAMVYARGSVEKKMEYLLGKSKYKIGEVVAVAQSYQTIEKEIRSLGLPLDLKENIAKHKGYTNKMFVKAAYMPHQIQITDIKAERLQDISEEDCLKEGVFLDVTAPECYKPFYTFVNSRTKDGCPIGFENPKYAFQVLIDKLSGFGTWEANQWVFCYSFKFLK